MKLQIDHIHTKPDSKLEAYATEKIGKLDHLMSRHARRTAHAEVKLKGGPGRGKKQFTCEVVIHLPGEIVTSSPRGETMMAAVDTAEKKLNNQLKKYKDKHTTRRRRRVRRFFGRLRR